MAGTRTRGNAASKLSQFHGGKAITRSSTKRFAAPAGAGAAFPSRDCPGRLPGIPEPRRRRAVLGCSLLLAAAVTFGRPAATIVVADPVPAEPRAILAEGQRANPAQVPVRLIGALGVRALLVHEHEPAHVIEGSAP